MKPWVLGRHVTGKFYPGGGVDIWNIYPHIYLKPANLDLSPDFASCQMVALLGKKKEKFTQQNCPKDSL